MENNALNGTANENFKTLIIATIIAIGINILIFLPGSYNEVIYGTIQFIWSIFAIFLFIRIYYTSIDKTVRRLALFFGAALVPWTMTLILWKILLPMFYNNDMAYYISGFGYLATYVVLIYCLYTLQRDKSPRPDRSINFLINASALISILVIVSTVLINLQWDSPRLTDMIILIAYLISDVIILSLCLKSLYLEVPANTRYLAMAIGEFVLINFLGDALFELRWLFHITYVFSLKVQFVINVIYNVSLIFLVIALLIYNTRIKERALDRMNKMLDDSNLFVGDVIKHSPDAMCICDASGNVVTVNDLFTRMFNVDQTGVIGKINLFDHLAGSGLYAGYVDSLKQGGILLLPQVKLNPAKTSDRLLHMSVKAYPTYGSDGKILNYVLIFEDTTDKVKTTEALHEAKNQAELYVDLMGHDINNINQIAIGYLELALDNLDSDGKLDEGDRLLIAKPYEALKNSSTLIDNVRKMQREKSGAFTLAVINVGKILEDTREHYSSIPGRNVTINYLPECQCMVMANELLKDVFINLVGNAVKHSSGDLIVNIKLSKIVNDGRDYCRVIVEDNGPGIPDNLKSTLFERLSLTTTRARGKGFGLCLIKMLVDDYGGKFWVENRLPGDHTKGSKFIVMLPIVESPGCEDHTPS